LSIRATTAGILERSLAFFLFNMFFDLASPPLLGAFTTGIPSIALVPIWTLAALWARRRVEPKRVGEDDVLVRWGHPPRKGTVVAHCLYVAAAAGNILVIIIALLAPKPVVTIGSAAFLAGLSAILGPLIRWSTTIFAAMFALVAVFHARATYHDIKDFETAYSSAEEYNVLEAARNGSVILGHEFSRVAQISVAPATAPTTSVEPLPGEVVGRHLEKWIGQDGPFIVDLEKEPNQHVLVFGPAGLGKTQTVWALILRYWLARRIPFLILDSMGEYVGLVRKIGGVVWTVPENFVLNPLRLSRYSPTERVNELVESLTHTTGLTDLQASEVGDVLEQAYIQRGILEEDQSTWTKPPPTWADLVDILESRYRTGYYKEQAQQSVYWTLRKLMRSNIRQVFGEEAGEFFDTVLKVPTVVDLSALKGQDIAKSLVTYVVFQRIKQAFETLGLSRLRLFVVLEEAHLILKTEERKSNTVGEPLPVKLIRMGRKYGFSIVVSTQLATDVSKEAAANCSTIIALKFTHPEQLAYIEKWIALSKPELEIYAHLPRGAAFIGRQSQRYPSLVKAQMVSPEEVQAARALTEHLDVPERTKPRQGRENSPAVSRRDTFYASEVPGPPKAQERSKNATPPSTEVPAVPRPAFEERFQLSAASNELTLLEKGLLRFLETGPVTMKELLDSFPNADYRKMLRVLEDLQTHGLIQETKVANFQGKGTVFYAALRADWAQSESVEHRAIVGMIARALEDFRPVQYMQNRADSPDLGLELIEPKACVEVETGRKKLTTSELEQWAASVKHRNTTLGYKDTLVVVPNSAIEVRYKNACAKYGLELATMSKLGAALAKSKHERKRKEKCSCT
jgi:hypothetical protein